MVVRCQPCDKLQDAEAGLRSYGYITGIKAYGIFISFFGGMKGLAHTAELPLAPEQTPKDAYQVGQVVKCRILSTDFSHQRLKLSLMGKKNGAEGGEEGAGGEDPLGGLQPGDVVKGTVREIESTEVSFRSSMTTCMSLLSHAPLSILVYSCGALCLAYLYLLLCGGSPANHIAPRCQQPGTPPPCYQSEKCSFSFLVALRPLLCAAWCHETASHQNSIEALLSVMTLCNDHSNSHKIVTKG